MKRVIHRLILGSCLVLTVGCSATGKSDTFTLTADMPPGFAYVATVTYVPVPGQSCNLGKRDNLKPQFNREWRTEYKPDAQIEIHRTRKGCELVLYSMQLDINAAYGKDRGDFGGDSGFIAVRDYLDARDKAPSMLLAKARFRGSASGYFARLAPSVTSPKYLTAKAPMPRAM